MVELGDLWREGDRIYLNRGEPHEAAVRQKLSQLEGEKSLLAERSFSSCLCVPSA